MNGKLGLTLRDWTDGSGELRAEVRVGDFSGSGSADFNLQTLHNFAQALLKFPLDAGETVQIQGGYRRETEAKHVTDEHLFIGISPAGPRGNVLAKVRLARPYDESEVSGVRYSVSVEFALQYQSLANFAADLTALLSGEVSEVIVDAIE